MNKEQQELLDLAYKNYMKWAEEHSKTHLYEPYTQEEFINKCKSDTEFSKTWGLQIEEKELTTKERLFFVNKSDEEYEKVLSNKEQYESIGFDFELALTNRMNQLNTPTRLITITYKDKTITSYE